MRKWDRSDGDLVDSEDTDDLSKGDLRAKTERRRMDRVRKHRLILKGVRASTSRIELVRSKYYALMLQSQIAKQNCREAEKENVVCSIES